MTHAKTAPEPKPLLSYVRVSSKGDRADGTFHSPKEQADRAARHARDRGYTVGRVLRDINVSGGTHPTERPGMKQALELIRDGHFGGIVAYSIDRLSRDPAHGDWLVREVTKHGGVVTAPDMPEDITTPTGEFTFGMLLQVAKLYRRTAGARLEGAKARAVEAGVPVSLVPLGFRLAGHPTKPREEWGDTERQIVVDEPARETIIELFERRAMGEGWGALATMLSERIGQPVSRQRIAAMIKSRWYVGEHVYGEVVGPRHEGIVDEALWQAANKPVRRPQAPRTRNGAPWLLSGSLICVGCGNRLAPWTGSTHVYRQVNGKRVKTEETRVPERRYRCNTAGCKVVDDVRTMEAEQVTKRGSTPVLVTEPVVRRAEPGETGRRVSVDAKVIEQHVVAATFGIMGAVWAEKVEAPELAPLEAALEKAERLLAQASSTEAQEALGDQWLANVSARRSARDKAAEELGRARAEAAPGTVPQVDLRADWDGMDAFQRREALSRYAIERVTISGPKVETARITWRFDRFEEKAL